MTAGEVFEVVLAALAAGVVFFPLIWPYVKDLSEHWRKRRIARFRRESELDALARFLLTRNGVAADQGFEWVCSAGKTRAWVEVDAESEPWTASVSVEIDAALELEILRPRFSKRARTAAVDQHVTHPGADQPLDIRFDVRRAQDQRGPISERLFAVEDEENLTAPLTDLLYRLGADAVLAKNGRLGVTVLVRELLVERVREILAALEAVAQAYSRRPEIGALAERYLWLEGNAPRCPYCHTDIGEGEPGLTACAKCKTIHHEACFAENEGCTLLGCGGTAPFQAARSAP